MLADKGDHGAGDVWASYGGRTKQESQAMANRSPPGYAGLANVRTPTMPWRIL
ncbi:hypothetical protein GCM10023196_052610 [Actinoallomurus vinaceus]|uniref:Uncharacterized protein n=1 Tax=Actinoallomurus vinaceus TaxID=1080074 RepID=A0ABP8UH90_9ACTN